MKTLLILLSCYSGWHLLFVFFFGMFVMTIVGFIIRAREQQIIREKRDLLKLTHAIQRYYWLVKKGKSVEANKKALKKFISVFSNRVIHSSPSAVDYALNSFRVGVFGSIRNKINGIKLSYGAQFHQPSPNFSTDEPSRLTILLDRQDLITSEDAIDRIKKVFEDSDIK